MNRERKIEFADEIVQILENIVDPFLVIDVRGFVLRANPAACQMFGYAEPELLGEKVNILMSEPFRSEHDGYIERFIKTGEARAIGQVRQVRGRRKSGAEFPCELSVSMAESGGTLRFYAVIRDASERVRMQSSLAQAERLAAMGELAAGVAHEVNNPVNTIINCAQLVKDGDRDPTLLDDIIQEGMRIATTVRDLLDFARDHRDEFAEVDIESALTRVLRLVSRRIERQGVDLDVEIGSGLATVRGRSHQLQQVLLNLILNARDALVEAGDHGDRPKRIEVTASNVAADGRFVDICVVDNGPGIPAENLERIFEPFFSERRSSDGTGLGLAVSRGIVEAHGGAIDVSSDPGIRTELRVRLPALDGR